MTIIALPTFYSCALLLRSQSSKSGTTKSNYCAMNQPLRHVLLNMKHTRRDKGGMPELCGILNIKARQAAQDQVLSCVKNNNLVRIVRKETVQTEADVLVSHTDRRHLSLLCLWGLWVRQCV